MTSATSIKFSTAVIWAFLLIACSVGPVSESSARSPQASVQASGPDAGQTLEDHVEVMWTVDAPIAATSSFRIERDGTVVRIAAPGVNMWDDLTAVPGTTYEYCVYVVDADDTSTQVGCDQGARRINAPTGVEATNGEHEDFILVDWSDRSEIEGGFNLYRSGGRALSFDGNDDYVEIPGIVAMSSSFSFEFWAKRSSTNTSDFVINMEFSPNGDPTNVDLELGFSGSKLQFRLGDNSTLEAPGDYTDTDWHHYAFAYDGPNQRRFIYVDGVRVATDVTPTMFRPAGVLEFGRREAQGNSSSRGYFHGALDEVRYWNTALTEEQVADRMLSLLTGGEEALSSFWPMDAPDGLIVPDIFGSFTGNMVDMTPTSWTLNPLTLHTQIGANLTSFVDQSATAGFQSFTYELAAFEDINENGTYEAGTDYESTIGLSQTDDGWRGFITPPGNVSASDGQYNDRVVVTWNDRSDGESSYNIYRDDVLIGTVAADATTFTWLTGDLTENVYCVAGVGGGVESVRGCDPGRAGGLAPPADVMATDTERFLDGDPTQPLVTYDDRVIITWSDTTDTEDGFEVFRDNSLLATLDADNQEYNDFSAVQGQPYDYCVRAFSLADPLSPAYSDFTCAPSPGVRVIVRDPENMQASDYAFEERVELSWENPSTTAMLFMVYRGGSLVQVLDFNMTSTTDTGIPSDEDINYCVSAATVTSMAPSATISVQGQIAQVLGAIRHEDEIRLKLGEAPSTLEDQLTAVRNVMSLEAAKTSPLVAGSANVLGIQGLVESGMSCDIGGRTLAPPTDVAATNDEFESHVEVSWVDNSLVERGYNIYRSGTAAPIAVVSANRTTYEDYTGTPGMLFDYTVEAFDDDDVSTSDSDDGKRTLKAPTALAAMDGTSETAVEMSWKDNSAAEFGYRIFRRDNGVVSDPFVEIGTSGKNENGYTDVISDPADLGKIFQYKVVAFDDYGESLAALDLGNTMLIKPGNVNASDVYDGYVTVVWVDRSNVEQSFEVTRREYSSLTSAPATLIATVLSGAPTSITDVPTDYKQYEYCVTTKLASGVSSDTACDIGKLFGTDSGGSGSGPDPVEPFKITSDPYPLVSGDKEGVRFGTSVAISGSTALIGAPGANPFKLIGRSNGLGFYVESQDAANNLWGTVNPPITPPTSGIFWDGAEHGWSVDINGNYMILGDPYRDNDANGKFSLWRRNGLSPPTLLIRDSGNQGSPNAGFSVAMADSFAIVGDNQLNTTKTGHGGAIICDGESRSGKGCRRDHDIPKLEELIAVGDQAVAAEFGYAVDIRRKSDVLTAMIGAPGDEKAYLFSCNIPGTADAATDKVGCSVTADWTLDRTFESLSFAVNSRFGSAVAIGDGVLVVGAPGARAIAMYQLSPAQEWVEIPPALNEFASDFGAALKVWDNLIIVGAPTESIAGIDSAGAVYVYDFLPATNEAVERVRYDARAGDRVREHARFGTSVDFDGFNYLIGAPGDDGMREGDGAVYAIPLDYEPPTSAVIPEDIELATPGEIRASDGSAPDRIQIRWDDESEDEDGHIVYRGRMDGTYERLGETPPNVEFFDDFEAAPGDAYTYCVTAYFDDAETDPSCDIGWRPPNGTISGRIAEQAGTGTEGATVCLVPEPNMSLLFDGAGGFLDVPVGEELDLSVDFSIEAWVRPHELTGTRYVVSKYADWGFALVNGQPQFTLFRDVTDEVALDTRAINTNEWTHVAASFGADGLTRNVTFYINGVAGTPMDVGEFSRVISDTLTIGHLGDREDPISMTYFNGEIDEVRIWAGARTTDQINSLMSVPLTGEEENLLGYWPLDQGDRLVSADLSESANHATLIRGVYLADSGTDLDVCTITEEDGNYSFSGIRYGELTEFSVIPKRPGRTFSPSFKKISLAVETPVQNEIFFTDVTAYGVSGLVQYTGDGYSCPVPEVVMHASKGDVPSDDNVKIKTRADGSFVFSVDPSTSESDPWYIIPTYSDAQTGAVHSFTPENISTPILETTPGLLFNDNTRNTLTGYFTGGDPLTCSKNIGKALIRLYTQDGCFDREFIVDSAVNNGAFPDDLDLPPLRYLMEVVEITNPGNAVPAERFADIQRFFDDLGAVEVDMRQGAIERSLIYRAPLTLAIRGLEEGVNSCSAGIVQKDEDNNPIRTLPDVRIIPEFTFVPLSIEVMEDYGNGEMCGVETGTISIFDAIADRVDADSTMALESGTAEYSTFGASPNIFSGARIQGVDRSFQKPLTVVAQVEGRKTLVNTEWALVEGTRERSSTFVSATTEEFPLMVLFDPPGSNSSAFIEEGTKMCTSITDTKLVGGGAGLDLDIAIGFKSDVGFSFGAHFATDGGAGLYITARTTAGRENTSLNGRNIEICMTTTEQLSTSNDMTWVGEDILTGVALNLIFALADVLETKDSCELTLTETLATDLDHSDPFETFYSYGKSHIALSLIPELENLIRVGGDATVTGDIDDKKTTVRLTDALENWKKQLAVVEQQKEEGLAGEVKNRSFSGGTEFTHVEAVDSTQVTSLDAHRIYFESENALGFVATIGYDQKIGVAFNVKAEWNYEKKETEGGSRSIGYTLSDGDTGDYFSVDVGKSPRYGTKVFGTKSGRSSNPWEANTQKRDNPIIMVDPPVMYDVDPEGAANFQLTLINGSESNERRQYTMAVPGETNTGNLGVTVTGDLLGGQRLESFLLDPGKALTINMDVLKVSPPFSYKDVGVILYPETEMAIWKADTRQPFALSDTAFFSVFYDSTGGNVMTSVLEEGWNWISINRDAGLVDSVFSGLSISHGDLVRDQYRASKFDSTYGWVGDLRTLTPGEGYRVRVSKPGSLRLTGAAVERTEPIKLAEGWNWVGYVPATRTHIGEALSSLSDRLMAGDAVVGQDGFAQYVPGAGWVGTLVDMEPGQSYVIHVDRGGQLAYPLEPTNTNRPVVPPRVITVEGPEWTVPSNEYTTSMTVVAEVRMSHIPVDQTTMKIAVFSGDEIRGTGEVLYVESMDKHLAFIQVFGEFEDDEELRVHVFDGETNILYEDVATVDYSAQTMIGQPLSPVVIDLSNAGQAPNLNDLPEEFTLHANYPNPFRGTSTIGYELPEAADVQIEVYDLLGRRVMVLVDDEQPAGRHKVVFDGNSVTSGIYFYRMTSGGFKDVGKMIVVK